MQIEAHNSILAHSDAVRLTSIQGRGTPLYSLKGTVNGRCVRAEQAARLSSASPTSSRPRPCHVTEHGNKLSPSVKPDARRQREQRQRLREAGLKPYELWLKPVEWQA
jgi:hypothetical protein